MALLGCSAPRGGDAGASDAAPGALALARAMASGTTPLPPRPEALALAETLEAQALREGAGARAVELHAAAGRLMERVWRVEGRDADATEALGMYRAAGAAGDFPGACEAAMAAARLAGEIGHDPTTSYAELYRASRRLAARSATGNDAGTAGACARAIDSSLTLAAGFRPAQRVLEAIDEGLEGEGAGPVVSAAASVAPQLAPPQVARIESWPGQDATRVVVVLDRPASYRVGDEVLPSGAPRTFLDLDGVSLGGVPRDTPLTGVVERVRADPTSTGSRVALDLSGGAWRRVFYLQDPYRIVVDVARHPPGAEARSARQLARVVLDPGHGGRDTGAVGPDGVREKDVTLDIAHRVAPALAAQSLQVVLTRDDDRYVSLEERTARANAFGADLFVSIHCNASESHGRRGIETYVLDATHDERASRVAARENATTADVSGELASILGGMRVADESSKSTRFAQLLQRAATTATRARFGDVVDGGVHTAGFYVLVGARMPSVLFETSYVSNAVEEQRLATPDYRQILSDAIVNAVKAYRQGR